MIRKNRFLIARRVTQVGILFLYFMGAHYGWTILKGNLSSSILFGLIPLTDPFALAQITLAGGLVAIEALIGALIVLSLYALFFGRAFCAWVCPMNMVTDLAGWIRKRLGMDESERAARGAVQRAALRVSRSARYWILAVALILSVVLSLPAFEFVSPISILSRAVLFGVGFGWVAIAAVFLFDLLIRRSGFCGHLCPLGAFYALVSGSSLVRVRYELEKCSLCMDCVAICPEPQTLRLIGEKSGFVTMGECVNCGRCIESCADEALAFGVRSAAGSESVTLNAQIQMEMEK